MTVTPPTRPPLPLRKKLLFSLIPVVLMLLLAEGVVRLFPAVTGRDPKRLEQAHQMITTGESPFFAPSPHTIFRLRPGTVINSLGFVGDEFVREKPDGVVRIACIGGSTTQGGNQFGPRGSYPFLLQSILQREGHSVQVYNYGVSNWTSAESLVNFVLNVQDVAPDIVVIHHGVNDVAPRLYPDYRSDFSHYRVPYRALDISWLERTLLSWSRLYLALRMGKYEDLDITAHTVRTVPLARRLLEPPPGTEYGFRRNLETIGDLTTLRGGHVALITMPFSLGGESASWKGFHQGIREHNAIARELCQDRAWALVDLEELVDQNRRLAEGQFLDLVHVKAKANFLKARLTADALLRAGWLPDLTDPSTSR